VEGVVPAVGRLSHGCPQRRRALRGAGSLASVALLTACGVSPPAVVVTPAAVPGTQGGQPAVGARPAAPTGPGKPMYQMDPQHTGRSPYAGPRRPVLVRSLDANQPEFRPPENPASRTDFQTGPVVAPDGTIYISTFAGVLLALRDTGDQLRVLWTFHPVGYRNPLIQAAARSYSWSSPPNRSRRYTALPGSAGGDGDPSGGWSPRARCGRAAL
jgi:hypothetical protein